MSTLTLNLGESRRVGFISTRFHGTDGVTLEAKKWARIFTGMEYQCFWMAGLLDTPPESSRLVPLAFFNHPEVLDIQSYLFGTTVRPRAISNHIHTIKERLKDEIYAFIEQFRLDLIIPQNALTIPMHVPLGLALAEVIAETSIPTIAHHHDFLWERERFALSAVNDYLQAAFPPTLPKIEHVVINSVAQKELARRYGLPSVIIPNIIDFENPPAGDTYADDLRGEVGLAEDDILFLQPTRVVARKGIEHSIELVRRLANPKVKLIFSHPAGDEGSSYMQLLRERITDANIDVRFIADRVGEQRGVNEAGQKVYTLFDIYPHADLVTYPSHYEGFGNAFLEAIYFKKPVVVNTYSVYARDIGPLGFKTIEMSQLISNQVIQQTREVLASEALRHEWAETNYQLGLKYFSYAVARRKLAARIANLFGESL